MYKMQSVKVREHSFCRQQSEVIADLTSVGSLFHSVEAEKSKLLSLYKELAADPDAEVLAHSYVYEASQDN